MFNEVHQSQRPKSFRRLLVWANLGQMTAIQLSRRSPPSGPAEHSMKRVLTPQFMRVP